VSIFFRIMSLQHTMGLMGSNTEGTEERSVPIEHVIHAPTPPVNQVQARPSVQTVQFRCATVPASFHPFTSFSERTHMPLAIPMSDLCDPTQAASIWARMKRFVLLNTIMRGKIVELASPQFRTFPTLKALLEDCQQSQWSCHPIVEFQLVLDFERASLAELLKHLEKLRERARRLNLPLFTPRSVENLAWTSEAIEGTTVPKSHVVTIAATLKEHLGDTVEPSIDAPDVMELKNHLMTIDTHVLPFADSQWRETIDSALACRLHHELDLTTVKAAERGFYRTKNVTILGAPDPGFSKHQDVAEHMRQLDAWLSGQSTPIDIGAIAKHHYQWVQIHPFIDGNGRVARLLSNCLAMRAGWPMFCIQPNTRNLYYIALRAVRRTADNDSNVELLTRLIAEAIFQAFEIIFAKVPCEDGSPKNKDTAI